MTDASAPLQRAASGLPGLLRSWLRHRTRQAWQSTQFLATDATASTAHDYGSVHLLVVDDNPVNLMVISAMLEPLGIVPALAADGEQAVALA